MNNYHKHIFFYILLLLNIAKSFSQDSVDYNEMEYFGLEEAIEKPSLVNGKGLMIDDSNFKMFIENIEKFDSLRCLIIQLYEYNTFPEEIKVLKNLEFLDLEIVRFDDNFVGLLGLQKLKVVRLNIFKGSTLPTNLSPVQNF